MTDTTATSNVEPKENFWKENPHLKSILLSVAITTFFAFLFFMYNEKIDTVLKLILSGIIGVITYLTSEWNTLKSKLKVVNEEYKTTFEGIKNTVGQQNEQCNIKLIKDNQEINDKIHRDLIRTNAVIKNKDDKFSVTARILSDFVDDKEYQDASLNKQLVSSIDVVREFAYQNLLLTPKYLEYLFYRKEHSGKGATRIVIIDLECQATLTYLFLSVRAGYDTYVLSNEKFHRFVEVKCNGSIDLRKIIKGNPYMIKIDSQPNPNFKGKFMDYRANSVGSITDEKVWDVLNSMRENSKKVIASDLYQLSDLSAVLKQNLKEPVN